MLATWVPPFSSAATAGFPPERASLPKEHTNIPLCVVSDHGQGQVMFLPYEPSRLIREYGIQDMFTMLDGYVSYMLGEDRKITVKAPSRVMVTVFKGENTHMIHFVNGIGQRPLQDTIPCFDLTVTIRTGGRKVQSVSSRIAGEPVRFFQEGEILHMELPQLKVWDMLLVRYE